MKTDTKTKKAPKVKVVYDTKLKCLICEKTSKANILNLLKNGWKMCCGVAMHIVDTDSEKVNDAVKSLKMKRSKITGELEWNDGIGPRNIY
jgi:hypothetical protein